MASWKFDLSGDSPDLLFLSKVFPSHGNVRVVKEGERFALEADALDGMTGDHVERLREARVLLPFINGWAMAQDSSQKPVELPGAGTDDTGTPFTIAAAGVAMATMRAFAVGEVSVNGVPQLPPAVGSSVVTLAATDEATADLLTLIGSHPHDFYTLYKIHEIIEDETHGAMYSAWTTRADSERFTSAANNRGASGLQARHAKYRKPPTKTTPMTLDESRQYVLPLASHYLRWVADGRPAL